MTSSLPDSEVEAEQTDDYYVLEADIGPTGGYLSLATTSVPLDILEPEVVQRRPSHTGHTNINTEKFTDYTDELDIDMV